MKNLLIMTALGCTLTMTVPALAANDNGATDTTTTDTGATKTTTTTTTTDTGATDNGNTDTGATNTTATDNATADTGKQGFLEQALSGLPQDKAQNFEDTMQQAHDANKDLYSQSHKLHEDMHNLLTADKFDQKAFDAKSKELRQVKEKIEKNLDDAFAKAASKLSQSDRQQLADSLKSAYEARHPNKNAQ